MSAAAPRIVAYTYRAEARFSAIFCPNSSTSDSGRLRVESLPRGVVTCAGGSAGSPIPRRRPREIPWLGRSSSLDWGIERPGTQVMMTLEVERICRGQATTKPTEVVHGSDGEADCPPGHRLGDNCWTLLGWRWESQHEVGPSKDDDLLRSGGGIGRGA